MTLNDEAFVELAEALAEQVLGEGVEILRKYSADELDGPRHEGRRVGARDDGEGRAGPLGGEGECGELAQEEQRARGGDAQTMAEEFRVYGLPDWFRNVVRVLKLTAGTLMVVGIWLPQAALVAGIALVILMGGAILMHIKVRDPLFKSIPATTFFVLSGLVMLDHWPG